MENEVMEEEILDISDMIYEVNGQEVMLDSDLAKLYQVETKRINEAVKNNPEKFPKYYYFNISEIEYQNLKSKFSTSNINGHGGSRKGHTAFTEQGIYMLATILKSKVATKVSIRIMDTFVKMRHYINFNKAVLPRRFLLLEDKVDDNTKKIDELFDRFNPKEIIKNCVVYKGEIYDAFSLLLSILKQAKKEIIIIDNYVGKEIFDILKKINQKTIIISEYIDEILKKKYESQYNNITFVNNDSFHDRFIIIDRTKLYVSGASLKDAGKKTFALFELREDNVVEEFIKRINGII